MFASNWLTTKMRRRNIKRKKVQNIIPLPCLKIHANVALVINMLKDGQLKG
jgi:hypothetical protein